MLEGIFDYTNELEQTAKATDDFLRKLRGGATRLRNQIAKAETEIKEVKDERKYAAKLKEEFKKEAIKLSKNSLFDATVNALKKTQEFDIPAYRRVLFEAIEDSNTYIYRPSGVGFKSKISVDIDLNRTAGRLEMWGTAIKRARKILGTKIPSKHSRKKTREKSAQQASRAWAGIYNRRGSDNVYTKTIKLRLENAAKIAPFWELIDKGNIPIATSDRGGYPTPVNKSLNFVSKTEIEINEALKTAFDLEREKYQMLISNYQTTRDAAINDLDELQALLSELRLDINSIKSSGKRVDAKLRSNTISKLQKAVQLIREGLVRSKGLRLSIKGSYRGKRFSTETMEELLQ